MKLVIIIEITEFKEDRLVGMPAYVQKSLGLHTCSKSDCVCQVSRASSFECHMKGLAPVAPGAGIEAILHASSKQQAFTINQSHKL